VNLSKLNEIINPIEKARDAIKALSLCNELVNQSNHKGFKARLDAVCTELQGLAADAGGLAK